jgi:O-antigen/teichoic acid export membrane protein
VRRGLAVRRGGSVDTTAGYLAVGLSAAALLSVGPRLLGAHAFSGLGLAWTVTSVFGFGIAFPTEQLLSRRLNVGLARGIRRPMYWLAAAGALVALAGVPIGAQLPAAQGFRPFAISIALAIVGWVGAIAVRGRLAGAGDLRAYGLVLLLESGTRIALVCVALVERCAAPAALGAAVGAPLLVAAAVGAVLRVERPPSADGKRSDQLGTEQLAFIAVALGYQVCLNAPPLVFAWRTGDATVAAVGAFVAANTYFRTPTVIMGGTVTHALVTLSQAWGICDLHLFRAALGRAMRNVTVVGVGASALVAAAAPLLLHLYYGSSLSLPILLLGALAVSSLIAGIALVAVQPLLAAGLGSIAALAWAAGALTTLALFTLSSGRDALAAAGLVAGPVVALAWAQWAVARLVASHRARPSAIS